MYEGVERTCPLCRQIGPYTRLQLGIEAALWVDCKPEYYAFVPCAHMCSEATVRYVRFTTRPQSWPTVVLTSCLLRTGSSRLFGGTHSRTQSPSYARSTERDEGL